ncbi:hypothetical protein [Hymenobacter wooponensis]|uniref:hypothetical protein n=1 Tax=Hymenobacter wooponensis TaxID=1525360 RepID=UPI00143692B5|nr:hypothetical protein [Hymenobacter wooponensis]
MNDTPLGQQMVAAALAATRNVSLGTDPNDMAVIAQYETHCVSVLINRDTII